jgi:fused signal recognition particle receptor
MAATDELVERLRKRRDVDDLADALVEEITSLLGEPATLAVNEHPSVVLVVGVNGTGKTTTIGKLAHRLSAHGRRPVGAADTFRAAADEQLEIWAQRAGPTSSARRGRRSRRRRLRRDRRAEPEPRRRPRRPPAACTPDEPDGRAAQVRRVVADRLEGARTRHCSSSTPPRARTAQQARLFGEAVDVTGVGLTKLDGTAKGGIVLPIAVELGLPVKLIGVGETLEDLQPFDPADFARALVGSDGEPDAE